MSLDPTLSIDIDFGDIFLHFRPHFARVSAYVYLTCEYRTFVVSVERGINIAAKAMRSGREVVPFGPNASEVAQ